METALVVSSLTTDVSLLVAVVGTVLTSPGSLFFVVLVELELADFAAAFLGEGAADALRARSSSKSCSALCW